MLPSRLPRLPRISRSVSRTMSSSSSPFPTTRPANWKTLAPPPRPGPTFAAQATLPRLPVPTLADTALRLKDSLRPIA